MFYGRAIFSTLKTLVTPSHRLFSDWLQSTGTISTHVIYSVTSLTNLWWSVRHRLTKADWSDQTVYHFQPLCWRPETTDLFLNCLSLPVGVDKIVKQIFLIVYRTKCEAATFRLGVLFFFFSLAVAHLWLMISPKGVRGCNEDRKWTYACSQLLWNKFLEKSWTADHKLTNSKS